MYFTAKKPTGDNLYVKGCAVGPPGVLELTQRPDFPQ